MSIVGETKRVLERQALYDDVWSRPMSRIAAELGITSGGLKRICRAMFIPTPGPGHWTRVERGESVTQTALPEAFSHTRTEWVVDLESSLSQKPRAVGAAESESEGESETPTPAWPVIPLASDMDHLHPLVRNTRAHERELHSRISWDQRKERRRFRLEVSAAALDRALIILDAFARGVEAQGFSFRCGMDEQPERKGNRHAYAESPAPSGLCRVQVGEEDIGFWLSERNRRVKVEDKAKTFFRDWTSEPTGVLEFSYGGGWGFPYSTSWKDGTRQKLESRIGEIVATLGPLAEYQRDERIRREREEERQKQLSSLHWHMEHQRSQEKSVLEKILQNAEFSERAGRLRHYAAALRARLIEAYGSVPADSPEDRLLQWIEVRTNMIDPLAGNLGEQVDQLVAQIPGLEPG